ncbi:hypothetical protein [Mangrovibacter plantisponsor]|uniref:Uncharacterized protein n=1 Tax=Mangrovibacter plantisponsor TaxID=451513 RepID=A0A317PWQ4_9ENTR|nr:hypothetical protein [Mangrovibacter plantisponsor]PWW07099.1 hypothetical protein DES37_109221 [Mangrovibacter plantisponsor]
MKTLSGKEFRRLFNRCDTGFYLSEFEYLKAVDPLFPVCAERELKPGYKRKIDVWCEEDAALYAEFIAKKERLKKDQLILKVNQVWSRAYPAYIYAVEERINIREKGSESFKKETAQEKQCKLSLKLEGLKELKCEVVMIKSEFEIAKDFMHYFYMISDVEDYINECDYFIYSAAEVVKGVIQCIGYIDKNNKASCEEFYSGSYECLDDDHETLDYLNESCAEGIKADNNLIRKNESLASSLKELHQLLVSRKSNIMNLGEG